MYLYNTYIKKTLMKYRKAISAVIASVLSVIIASVLMPIHANAQDFDKPIVINIDEIISEYPAAVHTFMYRYYNAIGSSKFSQRRLERITEAYEQACTREPSWEVFCSALYGRFMMDGYNPDSIKVQGAKILEDALNRASESQIPLSDRVSLTLDLANAYLKGDGVEENEAKAFEFYCKAYAAMPIFNGIIATCFLTGIGTPVDIDKACYYYALNYDDPELTYPWVKERNYERIYAVSYNRTNDVPEGIRTDYYEALRLIFKHDYDGAEKLLDKNCSLGHTPSMYALAGVYEESGDKRAAMELYKRSMEAGYLPSEFVYDMRQMYKGINNLSVFESRGESKAFPAFEALADKGYSPAQYMCALYDAGTYAKKSNVGAALMNGIAEGIAYTLLAANEIMDSGLLGTSATGQAGQSAYTPGSSSQNNNPYTNSSGDPVRKSETTREYEYVKTVSAIYEPEQSVTKLHIYRSRNNGERRASTVYDTKGLDRAATYKINSGSKVFYEERYSNYISYYGLCTYFND